MNRYNADPAVILAAEPSRTVVRYVVNDFGDRCITVWRRDPSGRETQVDGASVRSVDFLLKMSPRLELPPGLREMVNIRRNDAAPGEAAA